MKRYIVLAVMSGNEESPGMCALGIPQKGAPFNNEKSAARVASWVLRDNPGEIAATEVVELLPAPLPK